MTGSMVAGVREVARVGFGPDDLRQVRETVRAVASERIPDRVEDAVLAVHEIAVNSVVHGGGHGILRIEETPRALVFTVEDGDGTGSVPVMGRLATEATSGRGLWLAQQLSDELTIDTRPSLTRVGVHLTLTRAS